MAKRIGNGSGLLWWSHKHTASRLPRLEVFTKSRNVSSHIREVEFYKSNPHERRYVYAVSGKNKVFKARNTILTSLHG